MLLVIFPAHFVRGKYSLKLQLLYLCERFGDSVCLYVCMCACKCLVCAAFSNAAQTKLVMLFAQACEHVIPSCAHRARYFLLALHKLANRSFLLVPIMPGIFF